MVTRRPNNATHSRCNHAPCLHLGGWRQRSTLYLGRAQRCRALASRSLLVWHAFEHSKFDLNLGRAVGVGAAAGLRRTGTFQIENSHRAPFASLIMMRLRGRPDAILNSRRHESECCLSNSRYVFFIFQLFPSKTQPLVAHQSGPPAEAGASRMPGDRQRMPGRAQSGHDLDAEPLRPRPVTDSDGFFIRLRAAPPPSGFQVPLLGRGGSMPRPPGCARQPAPFRPPSARCCTHCAVEDQQHYRRETTSHVRVGGRAVPFWRSIRCARAHCCCARGVQRLAAGAGSAGPRVVATRGCQHARDYALPVPATPAASRRPCSSASPSCATFSLIISTIACCVRRSSFSSFLAMCCFRSQFAFLGATSS